MAKGNFIEYITDNTPNKYPIDGEQDGYYYERVEVGFLETIKSLKENIPAALSFIGNEDFTLKVYDTTKHWDGTLYYSTDYISWNIWDGTEISSGNKLLALRGTGNTVITGNSSNYRFVFTGSDNLNIKCYGNIETLLDYQTVMNGEHPTMSTYCYAYMFSGCTSLTQAPELPATTLADYCYVSMFRNCTSLTTTSELPATTLANYCYSNMFYGCTSLTQAPQLPATTLADSCYRGMFYNCTSLTTAPELPATTLADYCYFNMFYGCTSLTQAPELPATTLANSCYRFMFYNCNSLTKPPKVLPATTLVDSCYKFMFEFTSIECIPKIMATTYATNSLTGMFDDIKTLNVYSSSGTGHTYGWTAPSADYTQGMFGSNDGETEWAKLDGVNFPNSGTPTEGTTYYFKTLD